AILARARGDGGDDRALVRLEHVVAHRQGEGIEEAVLRSRDAEGHLGGATAGREPESQDHAGTPEGASAGQIAHGAVLSRSWSRLRADRPSCPRRSCNPSKLGANWLTGCPTA